MHAHYDRHHKVSSFLKSHQNTHNSVKYEVIWKWHFVMLIHKGNWISLTCTSGNKCFCSSLFMWKWVQANQSRFHLRHLGNGWLTQPTLWNWNGHRPCTYSLSMPLSPKTWLPFLGVYIPTVDVVSNMLYMKT